MIELKNISKSFKNKDNVFRALSDVSFVVPKGQIMGVIGESGAGKSTLIRCVNLLERPDTGEVIVDGERLTRLSGKALLTVRRRIGMIFQHFNLLSSRTVSGNVAFPLELSNAPRDTVRQRVSELLQLVGLDDKAKSYPANLSGGQKQRVAIARALANDPKVLLCDEATSALDPASTGNILSLLKEINNRLNLTVLMVSHDMNAVKSICDDVLVMRSGVIAGRGFDNEWFI
jgi:D-methionine transport system ATP-binding protein